MAAETEKKPASEAFHANGGAEEISSLIDHLLDRLGSHVAFGEPVTVDDTTVIPVADIRTGFGLGFGAGHERKGTPDQETNVEEEEGSGSGGGGGGRITPLGYIQITRDGVRFDRIYNTTKIILGGMALTGWTLFLIDRLVRETD